MARRTTRTLALGIAAAASALSAVASAQPAAPAPSPAGVESKPDPEEKSEATKTTDAKSTDEARRAKDAKDAKDAKKAKGDDETPEGTEADTDVISKEWFETARPIFELHGYYRLRTEFFSSFSLGRRDVSGAALWPRPADDSFVDGEGPNVVDLCGDDPTNPEPCHAKVQAGANMRLRIEPSITVSDNLRAVAQLDLLDNMVLGSTPEGYVNQPSSSGGYEVRQRGGYTPIGAFAGTHWAPSAGQNSFTDSIVVKRAWGEYVSPVGTFRFGRMPSHWGLGMLYNAGDGRDSDWGTTADRIMFSTGIPDWDLYAAGMWDFANEGAVGLPNRACSTGESCGQLELEGQRFDLTQSDDVDQWGVTIVRKRSPERAMLDLARGDVVLNAGFYGTYRNQTLESSPALGATSRQLTETFVRRGYEAVTPDAWVQFLWKQLRIEAEMALVWGGIENTDTQGGNNYPNPAGGVDAENGWNVRQFGLALETEFQAIEDRLFIEFGFGFATGDDDVEGINGFNGSGRSSALGGLDEQLTRNRTFSTFRFHPDYRVDLILWRNILQRVQSAYYFRPSIEYDFLKGKDGQRAGGGVAVIWSRATEPLQTPGNAPDLGFEIDTTVHYQAPFGTLGSDGAMTGFFTTLQFGVLFPLAGLGYLPGDEERLQAIGDGDTSLSIPLNLRWYCGIFF